MPDKTFEIELAGLNVRGHVRPGWSNISLFKEKFFLQSLMLMICYGISRGVLHYFFKTDIITDTIKQSFFTFLFIFIFMGGLFISGELNRRRATIILVNIIIFQTIKCLFYTNYTIDSLTILIGLVLPAWWVWKEPIMMEAFGIRRRRLAKDILTAVTISFICIVLTLAIFKSFRVPLKWEPLKFIDYLSGLLLQNIILMNFFFMVWRKLHKRGATMGQNILTSLIMINSLQAPVILSFIITGGVTPLLGMIGLLCNTLVCVLVMSLTFHKFQNSISAIFILTIEQMFVMLAGFD